MEKSLSKKIGTFLKLYLNNNLTDFLKPDLLTKEYLNLLLMIPVITLLWNSHSILKYTFTSDQRYRFWRRGFESDGLDIIPMK